MEVSWQLHVSALHVGHHQVVHVFSILTYTVQPDDGHHDWPKHVVAS
jgi:hypothetical protein